MSRVSESLFYLRLYDIGSLTCKWPFQGSDIYLKGPTEGMNCFDSNKKRKLSDLIQSEASWKLSSTSDWLMSVRKNVS